MRRGDAQGGISAFCAVFLWFLCMKKHPAPLLDKAGLHGYNIRKGTLLQQSDPHAVDLFKMTVSVPAERSSRFYTENVQYNDRTHKKLKCFLLHSRHLLPAADCGKGKEGLTAKSNSVRQYYIMHSRNLSTSRPSGRFLLLSAEFLSHSAPVETLHDHPAASRYAGIARPPRRRLSLRHRSE